MSLSQDQLSNMFDEAPDRNKALYLPAAGRYGKFVYGSTRAGQISGTPEISAIQAFVVLQEVIQGQRPLYTLKQACRMIPMTNLVDNIDVRTILSADEKVGELEEALVHAGGYVRLPFSLYKNVVHIAASDEAQKRAAHDFVRLDIEDAPGALEASANKQIYDDAMAGFTTETAENWATVTSGRSANSPYEDIATVMDLIEGGTGAAAGAGYRVTHVIANRQVWSAFFGNDFVKGQLQGVAFPGALQAGTFPVPGIPGIIGVMDRKMAAGYMAAVDSRAAVAFGDGPTEAARYRNEVAGYDAFIIRQWLQPQIVTKDASRMLTGILS